MSDARMITDDESSSTAKTSIKMTRSIGEDVGLITKEILEKIIDGTINLSYADWIWFVSQCWCDDIWINGTVKAINLAREENIDLNHNKFFLNLILERSPSELKNEFKKIHPIARLALMELVNKQKQEPKPERKYEDLWLNPKELVEKYRGK